MKRLDCIDYAKALCVIFVVFIHTGFSFLNNVVLFMLPLFFAATGYTFSFGKRTAWQNIKIRFKSIMIPYFLFMLLYTVIEILRAYLFDYGDISIAFPSIVNSIYGSGIVPFEGGFFDQLKDIMSYKSQPSYGVDLILPTNCHLWFLPAMFSAYVMFILVVKSTRQSHTLKLLVLILLIMLASSEVVFTQLWQLPFGIGRGALGAAFMLFGFWIREYDLLNRKSKMYFAITNALALIIFVGALLLGSNGSLFVRSIYGPYGALSVLITFVGGVAGIWLILSLCKMLEKSPLTALKKCLSYIGKNVMTVFVYHMAVKFLFDAVYLCIFKSFDFSLLDEYKMGLMPQSSLWFMIFEAIAVIAACVLLSTLKRESKRKKA